MKLFLPIITSLDNEYCSQIETMEGSFVKTFCKKPNKDFVKKNMKPEENIHSEIYKML